MKPIKMHRTFDHINDSVPVLDHPITESDLVIDQQIGSGTFGKVFSARLKHSGAKIAVKTVKQDKKYKTRELEIVQMLESPFIVKLLGTFTNEDAKH